MAEEGCDFRRVKAWWVLTWKRGIDKVFDGTENITRQILFPEL